MAHDHPFQPLTLYANLAGSTFDERIVDNIHKYYWVDRFRRQLNIKNEKNPKPKPDSQAHYDSQFWDLMISPECRISQRDQICLALAWLGIEFKVFKGLQTGSLKSLERQRQQLRSRLNNKGNRCPAWLFERPLESMNDPPGTFDLPALTSVMEQPKVAPIQEAELPQLDQLAQIPPTKHHGSSLHNSGQSQPGSSSTGAKDRLGKRARGEDYGPKSFAEEVGIRIPALFDDNLVDTAPPASEEPPIAQAHHHVQTHLRDEAYLRNEAQRQLHAQRQVQAQSLFQTYVYPPPQQGPSQPGSSQQGPPRHGPSQHGSSQHGSSQHGSSQHGPSYSGASQ